MNPAPPIDLLLARRELALEKRRRELLRENSICFFTPHEKQYLFYAAASFHRRYMRTGNRFGKSELGAAEDVAFALGYRPWMEQPFDILNGKGEVVGHHPGGKDHPLVTLGIPQHPTKGMIVTSDWDKSTEIFTSEEEGDKKGKLLRYIPKSAFAGQARNHSGAIDRVWVKHRNGGTSVIRLDTIKSFKQNPLAFESSDTDWAHFDEPPPERLYKAVIRGFMDRDGSCWFTCTPLSEPWIDMKFTPSIEEQLEGKQIVTDDSEADAATTEFWMQEGSTFDNPHISREAIARVMAEYTDDERETRLSGKPAAYAGLVYKEFSFSKHVRKPAPEGWQDWSSPPKDHCIYISIDYHFAKPNAILFIAVPPDGPAVVYHEIFRKTLVEEDVQNINDFLGGRPYQPIIVDPLASTHNKVTDLTAMDLYRNLGLAVLPATKDPVNGIRAVRALLKGTSKTGGPLIIVNHACKQFIFEIARGFVMDEELNKPEKKNDDMMECLYRLVLQGLVYIEPSGENDYSPVVLPDFEDETLDFQDGPSKSETQERSRRARIASRYRANPPASPHSFLAQRYN
jgi:hypothetical protein